MKILTILALISISCGVERTREAYEPEDAGQEEVLKSCDGGSRPVEYCDRFCPHAIKVGMNLFNDPSQDMCWCQCTERPNLVWFGRPAHLDWIDEGAMRSWMKLDAQYHCGCP